MMTLLSAADGIVGKNRTFSLGEVDGISLTSSCTTAVCRTKRGFTLLTDDLPVKNIDSRIHEIFCKKYQFDLQKEETDLNIPDGTGVVLVALDRDRRNVEVLAVVPDADESFRELDKFESCDVFRVTNHEECLRRVSKIRKGIAQ